MTQLPLVDRLFVPQLARLSTRFYMKLALVFACTVAMSTLSSVLSWLVVVCFNAYRCFLFSWLTIAHFPFRLPGVYLNSEYPGLGSRLPSVRKNGLFPDLDVVSKVSCYCWPCIMVKWIPYRWLKEAVQLRHQISSHGQNIYTYHLS